MKLLYVYSSPFCQLQLSWLKGNLIDVTKWHRMTLAQCGDTLTNAGNSRAENKVPPCCGSTLRVCQLYFDNRRCCMNILSLKQDAGKQKFLNCTVTSKQDEGYLTLFIPVWSISSNKEKCAFPVRHTACFKQTTKTQNAGGTRGSGTLLVLEGSVREKCPGLSQISKVCVPELLLNTSKVESTVRNCVCELFCGAPAELLLLFLPPGQK